MTSGAPDSAPSGPPHRPEADAADTRLRSVLDGLGVYAAVLEPDGRVREVNRATLARFGTHRDAVLGRPCWTLRPWANSAPARARLEAAVRKAAGGETVRFQPTPTGATGRAVVLDLTLTPLVRDGAVVEIVASAIDMTHARRIQSSLQRRELLHRQVVDGVSEGIVVHASDGTITACNAMAERLLDLGTAELLGRTAFDTRWDAVTEAGRPLPGDEQPPSVALRTGQPCQATYGVRRGDGQRVWLSVSSQPLRRGRYGPADGVITFFTDVSERRRAEEALDDRDARLRAILETAVDAVVTFGGSGHIETFNPAAERLFGWSATEFVGRHARELLPPDLRRRGIPEVDAWIASTMPDRPPLTCELRCRTRDGVDVPVKLSVGAARVRGRPLYTAIVHDLRERHRTEALLRESATLAATGRIAARIAHEINNPLAGLKNAFALLQHAVDTSHRYARYLPMITREIDRIARIVRQALDLYRPEARRAQAISIHATVHDVVALVATAASAREVAVVVTHAGEHAPITVPEDTVRQILHNLLANAVDASPRGTRVEVDVRVTDTRLIIRVSDEGPGVPESHARAIYEPFFTTKGSAGTVTGGGVGLGLATSRAIATALGGALHHESVPGTRTVFHLELPHGAVARVQQPGP
ncbi:MAG: PAS domain S-box protein [bacterium]|nr:PAS domain S-box protein [bacterium]